jgi:hypothetical protein
MAKFVPDNPITQEILNTQGLSQKTTDGVSYYSKAWRLKILLDRNVRGFAKEERRGPTGSYTHEDLRSKDAQFAGDQKEHREVIGRTSDLGMFETGYQVNQTESLLAGLKAHRERPDKPGEFKNGDSDIIYSQKQGYISETPNSRNSTKFIKDAISIIDLDHKPEHDGVKFYAALTLPFVPRDLNYSADSNFVGIATMGRNNPHYHFTGSEDSLTFTIDWFSNELDRQDVIFNCRWLESLTKGDGYKERPHRVQLAWGQDNLMFRDDIWLVTSASYILSDFVDSYKDPSNGDITRVGMLPMQAKQNVVLKRITRKNRNSAQIVGSISPGLKGKPTQPNQ